MAVMVVAIWLVIAALYRQRPKVAAAVYLLALPAFPFYWAPLSVNPWNDVTVQHLVAGGIALGLASELIHALLSGALVTRRMARVFGLLGILFVWSVSNPSTPSHTAELRDLWWSVCDLWVPFALACRLAGTIDGIAFLMRWVRWPALGVAMLTIIEYVRQSPLAFDFFNSVRTTTLDLSWLPAQRADMLRVQATLGQSIFLGFYLVMGATLFLVAAVRATSLGARVGNASLAALIAIVSFLPLVRGAMIGLFAITVLFAIFLGYRARIIAAIGLLGAVVLLLVTNTGTASSGNFVSEFVLTLLGRTSSDVAVAQLQNYDVRVNIISVGTSLIAHGPAFGYGDLTVNGTSPIADVANVFIEIGIVSGIVGLALFALFVVGIGNDLAHLWRLRHRGPDVAYIYGLAAVGLLSLVCFMDSSWPGQYTQLAFLFLGAITAWSSSASEQPFRFPYAAWGTAEPRRQTSVGGMER